MLANEKSKGMGEMEEGMDLADEVDMGGKVSKTSSRNGSVGGSVADRAGAFLYLILSSA